MSSLLPTRSAGNHTAFVNEFSDVLTRPLLM